MSSAATRTAPAPDAWQVARTYQFQESSMAASGHAFLQLPLMSLISKNCVDLCPSKGADS
ncbi:hypothetical protein FBY36_0755 [Arthrobacter sp. SLBN-122]|nr:hypothetical protein FBY36_0755 [Arthrobacter sp. SLBN-122]